MEDLGVDNGVVHTFVSRFPFFWFISSTNRITPMCGHTQPVCRNKKPRLGLRYQKTYQDRPSYVIAPHLLDMGLTLYI